MVTAIEGCARCQAIVLHDYAFNMHMQAPIVYGHYIFSFYDLIETFCILV